MMTGWTLPVMSGKAKYPVEIAGRIKEILPETLSSMPPI
jgi:hypothetical protein